MVGAGSGQASHSNIPTAIEPRKPLAAAYMRAALPCRAWTVASRAAISTTADIGAFVMEELKRLDKVAYVRFASVYRHFRDIGEFMNELKDLLNPKD